jgi:hypothetical protein
LSFSALALSPITLANLLFVTIPDIRPAESLALLFLIAAIGMEGKV